MFTGIIEHIGTIEALDLKDDGGRVTIHAPSVAPSLAVSNSIAVNGCCLTVVGLHDYRLSADLSGETIRKTSFGAKGGGLKHGARVNLEQPLTAGEEFGGHFVLGHVDTIGRVTHLTPEGENWWFGVQVPAEFARYIVPKGSITIDGVSPTAIAATVPPTSFNSNPSLSDESPGGTSETSMPISTAAKPVPETIHTPAFPPGMSTASLFARRSGRGNNLIAAANM